MSRQTGYSQEMAEEICAQIVDGKSMKTICSSEGMPDPRTIWYWLRKYPEFQEMYKIAKEEQADYFAEELLLICDDGQNDYMEAINDQGYRLNGENIQRSKLRVDTRKWLMSHFKPKKYGDKTTSEVTGSDGSPLVPEISLEDAAKRMAFLFAAATAKAKSKTE